MPLSQRSRGCVFAHHSLLGADISSSGSCPCRSIGEPCSAKPSGWLVRLRAGGCVHPLAKRQCYFVPAIHSWKSVKENIGMGGRGAKMAGRLLCSSGFLSLQFICLSYTKKSSTLYPGVTLAGITTRPSVLTARYHDNLISS